jgi:hypothetical protein
MYQQCLRGVCFVSLNGFNTFHWFAIGLMPAIEGAQGQSRSITLLVRQHVFDHSQLLAVACIFDYT